MVVWARMAPIDSYIWILSHQGVVLYERIMIRRHGLVEGLGVGLKFQKTMLGSSSFSLAFASLFSPPPLCLLLPLLYFLLLSLPWLVLCTEEFQLPGGWGPVHPNCEVLTWASVEKSCCSYSFSCTLIILLYLPLFPASSFHLSVLLFAFQRVLFCSCWSQTFLWFQFPSLYSFIIMVVSNVCAFYYAGTDDLPSLK